MRLLAIHDFMCDVFIFNNSKGGKGKTDYTAPHTIAHWLCLAHNSPGGWVGKHYCGVHRPRTHSMPDAYYR